tara:strand:+ start:81 stop:1019 length:939 start_codon:yes stop_codon:yes gene_type:complete
MTINTDYLKRINWTNHDGVNIGMINDFLRNQFYDRILSRYVKDQDCTDIGFGTGLLSIMALKHGARHVRAFESDVDRYHLGFEIIQRLNLQDRIELINKRYTRDFDTTPVTFTETVNGNLWWEGLWNSLPSNNSRVFLPGTYFLELWAVPIPERFAKGMCRSAADPRVFDPAVDIDTKFIEVVNTLRGNTVPIADVELLPGIVNFPRQQETDWGWVPYLRAVKAGKVVASYNAQHWRQEQQIFDLTVSTRDWKDQCVLIVPRMGMKQDNDILYLDDGHWGPGEDPIILVRPDRDLIIQHSVRDGSISYALKD